MRCRHSACFPFKQAVQNGLRECRSLRGIRTRTEFIQKNQTFLIQRVPNLGKMTDLSCKCGNMIVKALLVSDKGVNFRPLRENRTRPGRNGQTRKRHQGDESQRF